MPPANGWMRCRTVKCVRLDPGCLLSFSSAPDQRAVETCPTTMTVIERSRSRSMTCSRLCLLGHTSEPTTARLRRSISTTRLWSHRRPRNHIVDLWVALTTSSASLVDGVSRTRPRRCRKRVLRCCARSAEGKMVSNGIRACSEGALAGDITLDPLIRTCTVRG